LRQNLIALAVVAGIGYGLLNYGPAFYHRMHQSDVDVAKADLTKLGDALQNYRVDVGSYPSTDDGLAALTASPGHGSGWHGPYLDHPIYTDPWGHHYIYRSSGSSFDLLSYGADGEPGGQGVDADISYYK